jgi:hypothetical protein
MQNTNKIANPICPKPPHNSPESGMEMHPFVEYSRRATNQIIGIPIAKKIGSPERPLFFTCTPCSVA